MLVVEAKPAVCIHIILDQNFCLESKHVTNQVSIRPINESKLEGVLYGTKDKKTIHIFRFCMVEELNCREVNVVIKIKKVNEWSVRRVLGIE